MKKNLFQLYKFILFLSLTNITNLYSHNYFNGGCDHHCEEVNKEKINKNKIINPKEIQIKVYDSCLKKSLCRG